jgi:hypothetical protein
MQLSSMCLSAAKLMVLDRMSDFAVPQGEGLYYKRDGLLVRAWSWLSSLRATPAVLPLTLLPSSIQKKQPMQPALRLHSIFPNNADVGNQYIILTRQHLQTSASAASAQSFILVFVLLLIITAFVVVGVLCACRVSSALLAVASAAQSVVACRSLRLRWFCFRILSPALHPLNHARGAIASQFQDLDAVSRVPDDDGADFVALSAAGLVVGHGTPSYI